MMLLLHCRAYPRVYYSLKLVNAKSFRSGENIIGSVRGRGGRIYYFSVRSGSGQKITGRFGVGVPNNLAPQDSTLYFQNNLVS